MANVQTVDTARVAFLPNAAPRQSWQAEQCGSPARRGTLAEAEFADINPAAAGATGGNIAYSRSVLAMGGSQGQRRRNADLTSKTVICQIAERGSLQRFNSQQMCI